MDLPVASGAINYDNQQQFAQAIAQFCLTISHSIEFGPCKKKSF
jgi:hypothetical protein